VGQSELSEVSSVLDLMAVHFIIRLKDRCSRDVRLVLSTDNTGLVGYSGIQGTRFAVGSAMTGKKVVNGGENVGISGSLRCTRVSKVVDGLFLDRSDGEYDIGIPTRVRRSYGKAGRGDSGKSFVQSRVSPYIFDSFGSNHQTTSGEGQYASSPCNGKQISSIELLGCKALTPGHYPPEKEK
jgi:hypothetical protein